MRHYLFILNLVFIFTIQSCVKDKPPAPQKQIVNLSNNKKVYIINEGPFNSGNGSVSLYDSGTNSVIEDIYFQQNDKYLGNIVQSMLLVNNNFCIVVNNSGKIVFCDKNLNYIDEISGLGSPRYVLPISNKKAYVSDLYANSISVVDLASFTKTSSIPCNGKTEKMVLIYNMAYVTNTDKEYVYVINTIKDVIIDSIFVGFNAYGIEIDENDKIWVLSSGKNNISTGKLSKIDSKTNQIESSFSFQNNDSPNYLCFNKTKDTLYFINQNVYRMNIDDNNLPTLPFIIKRNRSFYGLGINPNNYSVFLADAIDYNQQSNVYIYDAKGNEVTFFKTAICSNSFYFE